MDLITAFRRPCGCAYMRVFNGWKSTNICPTHKMGGKA